MNDNLGAQPSRTLKQQDSIASHSVGPGQPSLSLDLGFCTCKMEAKASLPGLV